ncbi:MAG: hypothetical protein Q7U04_13375 [Bacteriovorax sp.]|nr:hypothetical protein [Bacteriovorax sp.]
MKSIILNAFIIMSLTSSSVVLAATKKKAAEKTHDERQSMALMHEKMATCLRSDKSMDVCRTEMMNSCNETMDKDECPMMVRMHHMGKEMDEDKKEDKKE